MVFLLLHLQLLCQQLLPLSEVVLLLPQLLLLVHQLLRLFLDLLLRVQDVLLRMVDLLLPHGPLFGRLRPLLRRLRSRLLRLRLLLGAVRPEARDALEAGRARGLPGGVRGRRNFILVPLSGRRILDCPRRKSKALMQKASEWAKYFPPEFEFNPQTTIDGREERPVLFENKKEGRSRDETKVQQYCQTFPCRYIAQIMFLLPTCFQPSAS